MRASEMQLSKNTRQPPKTLSQQFVMLSTTCITDKTLPGCHTKKKLSERSLQRLVQCVEKTRKTSNELQADLEQSGVVVGNAGNAVQCPKK